MQITFRQGRVTSDNTILFFLIGQYHCCSCPLNFRVGRFKFARANAVILKALCFLLALAQVFLRSRRPHQVIRSRRRSFREGRFMFDNQTSNIFENNVRQAATRTATRNSKRSNKSCLATFLLLQEPQLKPFGVPARGQKRAQRVRQRSKESMYKDPRCIYLQWNRWRFIWAGRLLPSLGGSSKLIQLLQERQVCKSNCARDDIKHVTTQFPNKPQQEPQQEQQCKATTGARILARWRLWKRPLK